MAFQIEVRVRGKDGEHEWVKLRPSGKGQKPYSWPTYNEAEKARRLCYDSHADHSKIRIVGTAETD